MLPNAELLGDSAGITALREKVALLLERQSGSRSFRSILIQGETGTGKGLLARSLHRLGPRRERPFVEINCAAIPEGLIEAELFGFERGAFTDARQGKPGLFHTAHRGILFLDEVGLLPASLQGKLLTVIEEQMVRRLGSTRSEPVDVAILAASSENLQIAVSQRRFHDALYHRLSVLTLWLPPLRERGSDIILLAEHFLTRACADYRLPKRVLAPDAHTALLASTWPGNVRELANVIERVAVMSESTLITAEMLGLPATLPADVREAAEWKDKARLRDTLGSVERESLLATLTETNWNITHAAARLGIPPTTLRYRVRKHRLGPGIVLSGAYPAPQRSLPLASQPAPTFSEVDIRWEQRWVALLRFAVIVPPAERRAGGGLPVQLAIQKVRTFGGRIEEIGLAEVVAVFGLEPVEDAPRCAAHAAMSIQNALSRAVDSNVQPAAVKIGIHVCHGLVGWLEERLSLDLESKRQMLRMLEAATDRVEPGTICVTASAAAFLESRFQLEVIDAGQIASDQVFRLSGGDRRGFGNLGRLTRFVGRGAELEQLRQRLSRARDRHGQVVAIVGEPGAGKSRLVWEVTNTHSMRGWLILQAGAVSYGKATSYLPVIHLLTEYFGIEDRDDARRIREKVTSRLTMLGGALETVLPAILSLLEAPVEDAQWAALDPPQRRRRTLDAVKRLLLRESQVQPVLVVVEDLHWIDSETQAVLDSLVESLSAARLVLLVNYRSEYQHGWGSKTYYTQLRLDPLPPESAQEMLQVLLGPDPALSPLERLLIERTEGNPFFLEEIVRTLVEAGVLAGDRAARRLARPFDAIQIPATVEAVLAARINRLPSEHRTLLQTAAVVGKQVPFVLLQAVAERPEGQLQDAMIRLQAAEFLDETGVFPDLEYTFKHALTHEVAYGSLLNDQQRALHARIVDAMARAYPGRLAEHVERLAHHALRSERWADAVTYAHRAGLKAVLRGASQEAVDHFGHALAALARLPKTRDTLERGTDLRLELHSALQPIGDVDRIVANLCEAEAVATSLGDQSRLGRVAAQMTYCYWFKGDLDRARDSAERACAIAAALGDARFEVLANYRLSQIDMTQGRYRSVVVQTRRSLEILGGVTGLEGSGMVVSPAISFRQILGWSLMALGDTKEAIATLEEGVRLSGTVGHDFSRGFADYALGGGLALKGHFPEAIPWLERALDLFRHENVGYMTALAATWLGWTYSNCGRRTDGQILLHEANAQLTSMRFRVHIAINTLLLGEASMLEGRFERASGYARRTLDVAQALGQPPMLACALRLLGDIHALSDPADAAQAEAAYRESLATAENLEARPLAARCHVGLGRLYRRAGKAGHAKEQLRIAATMLREMDMTYWLDEVHAEMRYL